METKIVKVTSMNEESKLMEAAKTLKDGGLVAFPTETVYGIGANALDGAVVQKIYRAKGRPSDNPLIVHVGDASWVKDYVLEIPEVAKVLMETFWPGPLTMIFKKNEKLPNEITGGLSTVGIRVPSHPIAREIIRMSGLPIAAPSANISGKPSPTIASHVIEDLSGRVDMIVDGGSAQIGLESTVLDVTGDKPMILRPGGVTREMLEAVVGEVTMDQHMLSITGDEAPKSPGMKYKHYAPKGKLTIYSGDDDSVLKAMNRAINASIDKGHKVGVIATQEHKDDYECDHIVVIGSEKKPEQIASNLFKVLRIMDDLDVERIYIRAFHDGAIGAATMNRLLKAAGNELVKV